jgi:protein-S-isoprenylcysteine O-methyltransferase Ste14
MLWSYAALIRNEVSPEVSAPVRWFLLLLMLVTPTFFLVLVMAIRTPPRGLVPLMLIGLFLVGWPMRLWAVRRLGGGPSVG